jgi:hypothetical protein
MQVVLLEAMHYPPGGSDWHSIVTSNPDWPAIEAALRKLDRDEWPFVWLRSVAPVQGDMPENGLCVMGGRGEYSLFMYRDGDEIRYVDETRGRHRVRIWESDQGSVVEERMLCNDIKRVLVITRYFADCAQLEPGATWVTC